MKVLIVGAAGYVGSIIRPAMEAEHECWFYDLRPVPGFEAMSARARRRVIIGDIHDERKLARAARGKDAIVNLALGVRPGSDHDVSDARNQFDVNAMCAYLLLDAGMRAGVRRFVLASSLSVYDRVLGRRGLVDERTPTDTWYPYGLTKRLGEYTAQAAAQHWAGSTIVSLRMMLPRNEQDWPKARFSPRHREYPTGPEDTRRLFLAALGCAKPGAHVVQACGDIQGRSFPMGLARRLLGWWPEGR